MLGKRDNLFNLSQIKKNDLNAEEETTAVYFLHQSRLRSSTAQWAWMEVRPP